MAQAMLLPSGSLSTHTIPTNPLNKTGSSLRGGSSSSSLYPFFSPLSLMFPSSPSTVKTLTISKFIPKTPPRKVRNYPKSRITSQLHQTLVSSSNFGISTLQQSTTRIALNPEQDSNSTDPSKPLIFSSLTTRILHLTLPTISLSLIFLLTHPHPALADSGAALFRRSCIGCHDAGGNVIQPGATLFRDDLEKNGVGSEEEIYKITYEGKGRMPGFGLECAPRGQCTFGPRLSDDEIRVLAKFVKAQSEQGWENVSSLE